MTRLFHLHIRSLAVLPIVMLPILGLMVYTHLDARRQAVSAASTDELRLARLTADDQSTAIQNSRQFLTTLSEVPEVSGNDAEACTALLDRLLKELHEHNSIMLSRMFRSRQSRTA